MKTFVAQINPTVGDIQNNLESILLHIGEGKKAGAEIIVFPELALSGAPLNDLLFHHDFVEKCECALQRIAVASIGTTVVLGSPATDGSSVFDAAVIFHNGKEIGRQHDVGWCWEIGEKKVAVIIGDGSAEEFSEKADLVVHLVASPWSPDANEVRISSVQRRVRRLHIPYLFVNLIGGNDGWIFDGRSFFCDANGTITFQAPAFKEFVGLVEKEIPLPGGALPIEEIHQALVLGISDFFRKQEVKDAVVALSGGIDSAVTASLAVEALGASCVHGVFLPSRFTSQESIQGVHALSSSLGIDVKTLPIEPIVETSTSVLTANAVKVEGLAAENLQSRIRSVLLMTITNAEGSLLIGTGNKTEMMLGYTTLYGDLIGALLPLGDLFKTEVYELARHLQIPHTIVERIPTAELRAHQKDTDDLPEYPLLDPVLRLLALEGLSPLEVTAKTGMSLPLVQQMADRMMRCEFKRRQGPCILRVSSKAFGMDILYPIVNKYRG
jgi:NAD+ synthase (glutamine-hydrolysing)